MKRLIGIVGYARTGKDALAEYLVERHRFIRLASGDLVRDVLYASNPFVFYPGGDTIIERLADQVDRIGWEAAKAEPEVRRLLQDLGTEGVRRTLGHDVWIEETLRRASNISADVVVTDTRFPNEAAKITAAGGKLWRITRPGVGPLNGHSSETLIDHIKADHTIDNDGTLEDLRARVDAVLAITRPIVEDAWPGALAPFRASGSGHYTGGPLHIDVI